MSPPSESAVMSSAEAAARFGAGHVRWMIRTGRWQQPARGVVVSHSGSLTDLERIRSELLAQGTGAVLAGLTAANLDGLKNFPSAVIHLLTPRGTKAKSRPGVVIHQSRNLGVSDVHPIRAPKRTRVSRSVVDAAAWASSDAQARAVLAASVQQGLTTPEGLSLVVDRMSRMPRRSVILETIKDVAGGSLSDYEIEFLHLCRRHGLPIPSRQVQRLDAEGRLRFLDAEFDDYDLVVEIDGQQHMEPTAWWRDMARDNDLIVRCGKSVLRYPGFVLRHHEEQIAVQIRQFIENI